MKNGSKGGIFIKRAAGLFIFITLILLFVACSDKKSPEKLVFEGRSNNWLVVLEVTNPETDGNSKLYKFSFIGEGNKPSVFNYEIVGADGTDTGEGTLKTQEEMWLNEVGNTKPVYKITQGPIIINWDGHTEELLLKVKN